MTPWKNSNGDVLGNANDVSVILPNPATFTLPEITTGIGLFTDTNVIIVTRESSAPADAIYKVTIGDTEFLLTSASTNLYVPEFPTVAAPIAAILGLFFIFGRKKEGL
ncbi:hypothetical protein MSWHS_0738 [Methanosarcina sp. WWM596]|nr:hypothetical protein MSWHS_0738 [Methanosarcina sp. WWM596]